LSSFSINFINFLIVTILLAAIAVVLHVQTSYIVVGAAVLLGFGLITSFAKQRDDQRRI
jgi:hypothetical protein